MRPLTPEKALANTHAPPGRNRNHQLTGLVLLFFTLHFLLPAAAGQNYGGGSGSVDDPEVTARMKVLCCHKLGKPRDPSVYGLLHVFQKRHEPCFCLRQKTLLPVVS